MVRDGVLVLQLPPLRPGRGLRAAHVVAHDCAVRGRRGTVARQTLRRARVLLTASVAVVLLQRLSRHRRLLLALGHVAGPRRVQRQQRALHHFILERVDELLRLQPSGESVGGTWTATVNEGAETYLEKILW